MTTILIDDKSQSGNKLFEYVKLHPHISQVMNYSDDSFLPVSEEELISLEEFKDYMEELAFERLGIKITL